MTVITVTVFNLRTNISSLIKIFLLLICFGIAIPSNAQFKELKESDSLFLDSIFRDEIIKIKAEKNQLLALVQKATVLNKYSFLYHKTIIKPNQIYQFNVDTSFTFLFNLETNSTQINNSLIVYDENLVAQDIYTYFTTLDAYSYTFDTGIYYIRTCLDSNYHNLAKSNCEISIVPLGIEKYWKRPYQVALLKSWLEDMKLNDFFTVGFYSFSDYDEDNFMPSELKQTFHAEALFKYLDYLQIFHSKDKKITVEIRNYINYFSENYIINKEDIKYKLLAQQKWFDTNKISKVFIYLQPKCDKTEMAILEDTFFSKFKKTLWSKLFSKISLYFNTKYDQIIINIPIPCGRSWVETNDSFCSHGIFRSGRECASGGFSKIVVNFDNFNYSPSQKMDILAKFDIGELANDFLNSFFTSKGYSNAEIDIKVRNSSHFEATITNIKGFLLKGENNWEKITIKCYKLFDTNTISIQFETDGLYTGGGGQTYPKETSFVNDYEIKHKDQLVDCSKSLSDLFYQYLKSKGYVK